MSEGLDRGDGDAPASDGSPASTLTPAEMTRLISYADEQERKVSDLQNTVSQLQHALESRVVIDRAVGILSERFDLEIADAFELLRAAARDSRQEVRALGTQLAEFRHRTPDEIAKAARARRIVDQP